MVEHICASRCANELRQTFVYDNRWFVLAAYIIEQLSGQTYRDFVKSHILEPLGMVHSTFSSKEAEPNIATPTTTLDDGKTSQNLPFWCHKVQLGSATEGSGFLFSTTSDLMKWLAYLIRTAKNENETDDPKIISSQTLKEVIKPRNISSMQMRFSNMTRGQPAFPEFSTPLYGMGVQRWQLQSVLTQS